MILIPSLVALLPLYASAPQSGAEVLEIRAREIWTGRERIENGALVIADGRIRSMGKAGKADPRRPVVVHDGVLTAGMVVCQTESGARGELAGDARTVLPQARTVYAFAPEHSDFRRALAAGITTMALTPGGNNLVGGLSCVVKTSGGRVLDPEATLGLSFTSEALGRSTSRISFSFAAQDEAQDDAQDDTRGTPLASIDGGPEFTSRSQRGTRVPTSYAGALALLEQAFTEPEGVLARAGRGELPVTIEAFDRHEVLRALGFARQHGLRGALRGAPLASDPNLVAALKASGLGVVVGPYLAGQTRRSLESIAALAQAGIPVGFALEAPLRSPEELRVFAARALWAGAPHDALWRALTVDGARLAGVGDAAGTLELDREADLVLWSGDPLDLSSRVEAVYVDGRRAWSAPPTPTPR